MSHVSPLPRLKESWIIENMVEAIQGSQKIFLVLSPDFVQSRWCLLEANLSVFPDYLERKPVIPIMLVPCFVLLNFSCLTYIDTSDVHFLDKVIIKVISTPNHEMKNATMVP
ncbi:toll-like receptor 2 type-1 precursor [Grus japonensis]|uniref:Toll-like receptor 2 type-1 n=1 Tax=Grus japonensis TaxID=30415 RepID=A0ABC9VXA7_GRUJA